MYSIDQGRKIKFRDPKIARECPGCIPDLARPLAILLGFRNGCGRRCCHLRQILPSALRSGGYEQTSPVIGTLMQWFIIFVQGIMQDGQESEVAAGWLVVVEVL